MNDTRRFASSTLAASEAVQRKAWRLLSHVAPPDAVDTLAVRYQDRGSTLYQGAPGAPGAQFNKVFSFGVDGDISAASIEAASDWLRQACCKQSFLMVASEDSEDEIGRRLLADQFVRFPLDISIFHMDAFHVPTSTRVSDIDVRPVGLESATEFGQVLSAGLEVPAASSWLAAFAVGHPGLTAYLAYTGSIAIGAAALFVDGDWGWLFITAVKSEFRKRGAQTALLARRLEDGKKLGVRTFNIGAFRPAPGHGDVFASYRNIERLGFKLAYDRPNYILRP